MAPLNNIYTDNPIQLVSRKSMRVIGMLIEKWSLDPASRPAGARTEADGRLIVFSADTFRNLLAGLPDGDALEEGRGPFDGDYFLREDIEEVELILRRKDRVSLLLPEPEAMAFHHKIIDQQSLPGLSLATMFYDIEKDTLDQGLPAHVEASNGADPATYPMHISSGNPLDAFLRPYLAAYSCTQCT